MAKIIRWDTPFNDKLYPSVLLLADGNILKALVAPDGSDQYPKYLVNFGDFIAYACMEEAWCPERDFDAAMFEGKGSSAYQYLDSPWLQAYERGRHFVGGGTSEAFLHFLIFGGDCNIEVITPNVPTIERIEEKGILVIECEV